MASSYSYQNMAYSQITATFGGVAIPQDTLPNDISLRLENQRLRQERDKWKHLATTDTLTGIPNRLALIQHLEDALSFEKSLGAPYGPKANDDKRKTPTRNPVGVAIGFIDLDGFKAINDTYGHAAGDLVLKE
ncbi:MAG: GGDEF domain-containing protein, partial [Pseudomonadota bacterium]